MTSEKSAVPARRLIVLGASNVSLGLHTVCGTAAGLWGQPLELLAAIGHGRSYGLTSTVLGRTLPSIRVCDLWDEWRARQPLPSAALITDIGNDIMYGASPPQIEEWVRDCVSRLRGHCERVIVTGLPLGSLARLGPRRFLILRSLLFPRSRLSHRQALDAAEELDGRVSAMAREWNLEWIGPDPGWYGIDPIHIRRRHRPAAWRHVMGPLENAPVNGDTRHRGHWKLRGARPKLQWFWGRAQHRAQPAWVGPDGSSLSLY